MRIEKGHDSERDRRIAEIASRIAAETQGHTRRQSVATRSGAKPKGRPVRDSSTGTVYPSAEAAARALHRNAESIRQIARNAERTDTKRRWVFVGTSADSPDAPKARAFDAWLQKSA